MLSSVHILVAEDNEDDVILMRRAFRQAKVHNTLHHVWNGAEALAFMRREEPHRDAPGVGLVLLDINMPRMDGFETLREIKADPSLRHVPVVMLTSSDREEDIGRSYSGGACSYITKPVEFDDFRRVIHQFGLYWTLVSKLATGPSP